MKLRLPREHGTWGMFFVPFAVGWFAAGRVNAPVLLLLVASAAVFLSRETLLFWWRARHWGKDPEDSGRALLAYLAAAACAGAPLVVYYRLYALVLFGIAGAAALAWNAESAVRRQARTAATEAIAVVSASLNAPAAFYAASARLNVEAAWLWALCALYFASSIFYVKLRVQDAHGKSAESIRGARTRCAAYHLGLIAALLPLAAAGRIPTLTLLAFTPIVARGLVQVVHPSRELNLKRIGWLEVTYSVVFAAAITAGFAVL